MMFEKAAHSGYNLMPGSIDEEHTEIVPTVHTMGSEPSVQQQH